MKKYYYIIIGILAVALLAELHFLLSRPQIIPSKTSYKGEYLQVLKSPWTEEELVQFDPEDIFGGGGMRPSNFKTTLARSLPATASASETIYTTSLTTKDSHTLTSADIGDFICMHINPGASNDEIVCCTGISSTNFTGCTRGYNFYSMGTSPSNVKAHSPGEIIIISNDDHYLKTQYSMLDDNITVTGGWKYATAYPYYDEALSSNFSSTASSSAFADKNYVDLVGAGGFTAANVGTDYGLKALGTYPEKVGIDLLSTGSGLAFSGGDLYIYASESTGLYLDDDGQLAFDPSIDFIDFTFTGTVEISGVASISAIGSNNAQGDIYYHSGDQITRLGAGTSGQFLKTQGAGANPIWATVSGRLTSFATNVTVINTETETNLISATVPANTLGTTGILNGRIYISDLDTVSPYSLTLRFYYGTTSIYIGNIGGSFNISNWKGWIDFTLFAAGTTNSQKMNLAIAISDGTIKVNSSSAYYMISQTAGTASIDSTSAQTIRVTAQFNSGSTNNSITAAGGYIELITN